MNAVKGYKGFVSLPLPARFWAKVRIAGADECWQWIGAKSERGYGRVYVGGRSVPAHRVSWQLLHGREFPAELDACHSCDNPSCVNPSHIWPGSPSQNALDHFAKKPVSDLCVRGHWRDGVLANGRRYCRTCVTLRSRQRRATLARSSS